MEKRAKMGLGALLIISIVYVVLGGSFTVLGLALILAGGAETHLVGSIFTMVGSIFLILGLVFLVIEIGKKRRANRLIASGRYVWGEVVDCVPNYNVRINNSHPYILTVRYVDGRGQNHIFKSPSLRIYRDPGLIGKQVRVYYGDDRFRNYYVDTDGILPNFIEH